MLSVILVFALFSYTVSVELLSSEADDKYCLGSLANWTCTVNGSVIGWDYDVHSRFFTANNTNVLPLGSSLFRTGPTIISGGVSTSVATANLSSNALNGTYLECTDGTNSSSALLNLKDSLAATSADVQFDPVGGQIIVTWSGAICVPYYRVIVNNSLEDTVTGTSFSYTPQSPGIYFFQINSINYFGREIGFIPGIYYSWIAPSILINVEFFDSIGLRVTFQDNEFNDIGQPPVNYCNITLNGISSKRAERLYNTTLCELNEAYIFPIIDGVNYTYIVIVGNVVGSINETGVVQDLPILPATILIPVTKIVTQTMTAETVTVASAIGDPVVFAVPFIVLGVLIVLSICWMVLRICWKRQCCCPRIWRSSFWLIFFCYDCCTYEAEEKGRHIIGLNNPNAGGEKGNDTSL